MADVKGMSPRQQETLARLVEDKQIDPGLEQKVRQALSNGTTSKLASAYITQLIAADDKPGKGGVTHEGWFKHPQTGALYNVVRSRNGHLIALGCHPKSGRFTKWVKGMQYQLSDADCVDAPANAGSGQEAPEWTR